ncbi:scarecrow-like protein 8, partial [Phtheirospermum japonicum]
MIGKRSLAEFQLQNQGLGFYLRNVKPRPNNYQHASPISTLSPVDFSAVPSISPEFSSINPRYSLPSVQQHRLQPLSLSNRNIVNSNVSARAPPPNRGFGMNYSGQGQGPDVPAQEDQSEKNITMSHKLQELEKQLLGDEDDNETVSVVTNSEWSDTIQDLIGPTRKPISPSPTSSSSSCSSTSASPLLPCPKQALIDAAAAISDGKPEAAAELLTRLQQQVANARGTSEQRLAAYMVSAMKPRVSPTHPPPAASEVHDKEHAASTQMLYDVSPCFKLGFMAANLAILEATAEQGFEKIHVLDFDIGQGGQYLYKLPDESVTTENLRDETLRRVKGLSPEVMTVVEQEMNTNTAPLVARVRDAWEYYGLLFDSLDSTMSRESSERVRIEEGLGRKMANSVACEGRDRIERCEVFGKW